MNCLPLFALASLSLFPPAMAGSQPFETRFGLDSYLHGEYLLGDWGGHRNQIKDNGIEFFGYWTGIYNGNVSGGRSPGGSAYVDDFWVGINFDLEKLLGWKGGHFTISGINRDGGKDLTRDNIGSVYSVQQSFGGQRPFLYQVYLDQELFDRKLAIKIGRFSASDDFNGSSLYGLYVNNGINGNIRNVLFDTQFSAYPFATWAARVNINPAPDIYLKLGAFQTSNRVFENDDHGLDWSIATRTESF